MDNTILRLKGINKSFSGVQALKDIDIEIKAGTIYCLLGENGCGKSTLIKIICGVYSPDSGEIELDGKVVRHMTPIEAMSQGIEVIYQDLSVFPNLTVAENIMFNTEITERKRTVSWKRVKEHARETMRRIGVDLPLDAMVGDLPVASRQLIAICRAIAHNARILIMDEPTTALTKREVDALFETVRELNKSGISVIFVSHKMEEIMQLSQYVYILRNGEQVASGPISEFTKEKIVYHMTGREIAFKQLAGGRKKEAETVLRVENLNQRGGFIDISFELKKGEILGLTGLLGSGRTALANALFGIHPADRGEIYLNGKKAAIRSVRDAVKHGIAYVPEDRLTEGLFLEQSIRNNMIVTVLNRLRSMGGAIDAGRANALADDWIDKLHIKAASKLNAASSLSGGNQQKIVIAKWLATEPGVLILNGPTVGVDVGAKADIIELIRSLAEEGMSIILASDDVSEIMACCDRIMIMRGGRIVAEVANRDTNETELSEMIRGKEKLG